MEKRGVVLKQWEYVALGQIERRACRAARFRSQPSAMSRLEPTRTPAATRSMTQLSGELWAKGLTRLRIPSTLALLIVPDIPRIFYPARNASVSGELTDDIA